MYIDGKWLNSSSGETFESINPYNQEAFAIIPQASNSDIDLAIQSANHAFETNWSKTNGLKRANLLNKLADLIEENAENLAERSEEHTSELQSRGHLVCRLLLEKKRNAK